MAGSGGHPGNGEVGLDAETPPSVQIVEALAENRGCETTELDPLYEVIDVECLDALVESSGGDLVVELTVDGCRVEVDGDGSVTVH